jgi:hypothetical protein
MAAWVAAVPVIPQVVKQVLAVLALLDRVVEVQVDLPPLQVPTPWPDPAAVVMVLLLS